MQVLGCPEQAREDGFVARLASANARARSWREKLDLIRGLLADETRDLTRGALADIAIYLRFLNTGEIPCEEDGRHFRPSHHARIATKIHDRLLDQKQKSDLPGQQAALAQLTGLRRRLLALSDEAGPEPRLADIALEDFAFPLLSEILNGFAAAGAGAGWDPPARVLPVEMIQPQTGGNKSYGARRLLELAADGDFTAPPGLVVPFGVMEQALRADSTLQAEYVGLAGRVNELPPGEFSAATARLREWLARIPVPDEVHAAIVRMYGPDQLLAVRSSANSEDLPAMAGAGLYESVAAVWASLMDRTRDQPAAGRQAFRTTPPTWPCCSCNPARSRGFRRNHEPRRRRRHSADPRSVSKADRGRRQLAGAGPDALRAGEPRRRNPCRPSRRARSSAEIQTRA